MSFNFFNEMYGLSGGSFKFNKDKRFPLSKVKEILNNNVSGI